MSDDTKKEKILAVYLCSGCGIGEAVDISAIEKTVTDELKIGLCKVSSFLCEDKGVNQIKEDISGDEGINACVIGACSVRACYDIFDFGDDILLDRVDLREKVAWVQEPGHEDTLAMAQDYIRMGVAKIRAMEFPEPVIDEMNQTVLVIGGGVTGLAASKNAADAGHPVILVEKSDRLGGFAASLSKTLPRQAPYTSLEQNDISDKIKAVEEDDAITVHLNTTIEKISGAPGMFDVTLQNGSSATSQAGAIVVATGFRPYEKEKLTHLGAGIKNVITNVEFEKMAFNGKITRPSDNKVPKSVLFIQCAGSRDENHLPYCSSVCCSVSLKQASIIREQSPDTTVTIIYKDIRTPANGELFYKEIQQDPGVMLTKGEVSAVDADGDDLLVSVDDTLIGGAIKVRAEMVVLATGMVSSTYDASVTVDKPEEELTDRDHLKIGKSSILNLAYRKGSELPHISDGFSFPDSHFICFPYETQRTGIYTAGPARSPADIATSERDAAGAALKAIQCITLGGQGKAVHPRSGDTSYPDFFLQRCTQCKRCTEECPYGTLDEDEKGTPKPNPTRCRRCGVCMGACPERIINFANFSVPMISSMIKSIDIPDEFSGKLRALVFVCENDAMPALDLAGINRLKYNPHVRIIPLRCLGSVNIVWIADALASGVDGILMLGCKHGDDYQCHNITGSQLAEERMSKVQETLDRLMLESERIQVEAVGADDAKRIPEIINGFVEKLETMEPNPYKGF